MNDVTSQPQRDRRAKQHLREREHFARRGLRRRMRLAVLQTWARRYSAQAQGLFDVPRRILVIRPDHLGDLLFSTPAFQLLRSQFPQSEITALVGPWGQTVLAGDANLDGLLTCPFPGFTRRSKGHPWAPYRLLQAQSKQLRPMQFDLALILRFDHWWGAWLSAAAGIPVRIGYDTPEAEPFLTIAVPYLCGRHEVIQNLALVMAAAGNGTDAEVAEARIQKADGGWRLQFSIGPSDEAEATRLLAALGPGKSPLVGIHPGSGAPVKRWRSGAWAELAGRLIREHGAGIVFSGSAGEAELIEPVLQALGQSTEMSTRCLSLAGRTSLGVLAAVYRRCSLVIGPDSGPLHLAVAVGVPTIHLFGPVDSRAFGPWGSLSRHRVITSDWRCIPCNRLDWPEDRVVDHGCVRDITVQQVLAEARRLLHEATTLPATA